MEFNVAEVHEAIAAAIPDAECIVFRERRLGWGQVHERTRRLANYLRSRGLGSVRERSELEGWESGQDHLALYLYNGNEYLEGMLGAFKARVAPFNVNYRYVEEELLYLLRDASTRGIVYHSELAPTLASIRPQLEDLEVLIQVADGSGNPLLDGAVDYEEALASSPPDRPEVTPSPDDLYILYTGGTTGMPKGVLWRQADIFMAAFGGRSRDREAESIDEVVARVKALPRYRTLPTPPFMHGAAHWSAFSSFSNGSCVVVQNDPKRLDPDDVLSRVEQEQIAMMLIVGDAFARPIVDQLHRKKYDLSSLRLLITGGAALGVSLKQEILRLIPGIRILDSIGSSESGQQGQSIAEEGVETSTGSFEPAPGACVLSADMTRVLEPGHEEIGWFAKAGRVPLGYLGDPEKTAKTFPVIGGVRYSVPGDRARHLASGKIEVHGRDSVTINSGGEKIFAEEVEHAVKSHPGVYDAVVCGRPSERWGQEVVAIVRVREGHEVSEESLLEECARHIARYKLPKAFLFRDEIVRSPSGKADYRWAKEQASSAK